MKRMIRIVSAFAVCAAIMGSFNVRASAAQKTITTKIGVVNANSLRLRSGPSKDYSTLDYAFLGEYVNVTGKSGSW